MVLNIARFEVFQASSEIREFKDQALALGKGLPVDKSLWQRYQAAKGRARLALTMVAIVKTYAEFAEKPTDLPAKAEFSKFVRAHGKWRRLHAIRGKERSTLMRAYRRLVKAQNRLKRGDKRYEIASKWADDRLMEAAKRRGNAS